MIINKTSYMRTFSEFCQELSEAFPFLSFNLKNWTAQDHCGWTEALYEAQGDNQAIEYMQDRTWRYHFNGVIGQGIGLDEAIKDHKVKYNEHLS